MEIAIDKEKLLKEGRGERFEEMLENWVANGTVTYGGAIGFSAYQSKCTLNNLPAPDDGLLTIANGNLTLTSSNGSVTYATYNGSIWTYGSW